MEKYNIKNEMAKHIAALDGGLADTRRELIDKYYNGKWKEKFKKYQDKLISEIEENLFSQ